LALHYEVDVIFQEKSGRPMGRLWNSKFGSIATIRRQQVRFQDALAGRQWVSSNLIEKLSNQEAVLETFANGYGHLSPALYKAIQRLEKLKSRMELLVMETPEALGTLRGLEGKASATYFKAAGLSLPEEYRFEERSRRPALDPVNCLLNYGYGVLYGKLEGEIIRSGLDPALGIFHRDDYNRVPFVYDVIEPFRAWVDVVVFGLCRQKVVWPDLFDREGGGYWLNEFGKRLFLAALHDHLDEIIAFQGQTRTRQTHLQLHCQSLAQTIKNLP
jgi:CRISPR-associated protein Cas1